MSSPVEIVEQLDRAPLYRYDDRVPAELLSRWHRLDGDRVVVIDLVLFLGTVVGAILALAGAAGLLLGRWWSGAALLVVGIAAAVLSRLCRRRLEQAGRLLPAPDIDLIVEHRTAVAVGGVPNESAHRTTEFVAGSSEAELVDRALRTAHVIATTTAWRNAQGGEHGLLLDPYEEARQIAVAADNVQRLRAELGPRPDAEDVAGAALHRQWTWLNDRADAAFGLVRQRVQTFEDYASEMVALSHALEQQSRLRELERLVEGPGAQLFAQDAMQELSVEHLDALRLRAASTTAQIERDSE